jgi:L-methionine (R)-S-oxide reductase
MNYPSILDNVIERSKMLEATPDRSAGENKATLSQLVSDLIEAGSSQNFEEWELEIVNQLRHQVDRYSWVGLYWVIEEFLYLGAWSGPESTDHVKIPVGAGICGLAARTKETVIVDDVEARSEYLACFPSTRSEIVVPILLDGEAIGEIDIDGDTPDVYTDEDREQLERLATAISERLLAS